MSAMLLDGERSSGEDVRTQNITAAVSIANIVKSSLGPVGLDKMLVDEVGDVIVTNDGATILKQLEIEHPAAKVLVELAELQDKEVGDGTTSVVIIAAELLKRANDLVKYKIHPTTVMAGYRLAVKEAVKYIKDNLLVPIDQLDFQHLLNAAKTSMSSKILGPESDFFADIAARAVTAVKFESRGENNKMIARYPVSAIHVLKCHGRSALESQLVLGYALNCTRAAQGMPTQIKEAKIACLDINLKRHKMMQSVYFFVTDPKEIEAIHQREMDITKERIQKILSSGANVILTTQGIDDLCLKYFVEAGAIAVRRVTMDDMKRIAKATGATLISTIADMEGNENFDPANLGYAGEVVEERVGDGELIYFKETQSQAAVTVVLRGANTIMLDEMDRSLHDALMVVKRMLESKSLVAGGGAVETALSIHLEDYATTLDSKEQLAILEFAEALLVIPKTLSLNAAQDATELVAQLRAVHSQAQRNPNDSALKFSGLDLINGRIRNSFEAGVVEPTISKIKSLKSATEAAISILRIDDMIKLNDQREPPRR